MGRQHRGGRFATEQTTVVPHLDPRARDTDRPPFIEPERGKAFEMNEAASQHDQKKNPGYDAVRPSGGAFDPADEFE